MWTLNWILYEHTWKQCLFRFRFRTNINEPLPVNGPFLLITVRIRSCVEGNVFTPVCQSFCSNGVCMAGGVVGVSMRGREGMCGWGACMAGRACVVRAVGHAWWGQGACMAGGVHGRGVRDGEAGGHAWQERRPLQRTVRILLECFLVLMLFFSDVFDCFLWKILVCFYDPLSIQGCSRSIYGQEPAPSPTIKSDPWATITYHPVVVIYKRQNCTEGLLDTAGSYQHHICLSASL